MRRVAGSTLVALGLLVLVFGMALGGLGPETVEPGSFLGESVTEAESGGPADAGTEPKLVRVGDAQLWPYVGPDRSFDRPASSINVVVRDGPDSVRRYLTAERGWNRSDDEWVEDPPDGVDAVASERVPWQDAPGAPRYVYVADAGWLAERYQLHRGEYFGTRLHLRAYGSRDGNWTAIQAHAEHWDWFTITHTVDSVEDAQLRIEEPFLADARFDVRREYYANGDTYDADGWTTVVAVALAPLFGRRLGRRLGNVATVGNRRRVALAGALAAFPLGVRFGAIFCERYLPWLSPDAVVAIWYPVLVCGVPLAAYAFGRRLPASEAGALAALGFGTGIVLDYAVLGAATLPIPVAVHRAAVVVAVGLLAAGASRSDGVEGDRRLTALRAGAALWVVAVVAGHLV